MFKVKFKNSQGIKTFEGSNPLIFFDIIVEFDHTVYTLNLNKQILNNDIIFENNSNFQKFDAHIKKFLNYNQKNYDYISHQISKIAIEIIKFVFLGKCDYFMKEYEIKIPD